MSTTPKPSKEQLLLDFEAEMRRMWNANVTGAQRFTFNRVTINGVFSHYMEPDTDNAWIGYQVARLAKR